jgi:HSP20 family protein
MLSLFRDEIDSVFDRFLRNPWAPLDLGEMAGLTGFPRTDLAESENDVTVTMELPGIDAKNLEIDVTEGALTIRGEKKHEQEERRRNYHYVERSFGSFSRTVPLPSTIDSGKVEARCKDGVLTVTVAKRPDAKPKRIPVKAE